MFRGLKWVLIIFDILIFNLIIFHCEIIVGNEMQMHFGVQILILYGGRVQQAMHQEAEKGLTLKLSPAIAARESHVVMDFMQQLPCSWQLHR